MIAVIDIGTTGCKTALFDKNGNIKGAAHKEYSNIYFSSTDIEQNPDVWIESLIETMRNCLLTTSRKSKNVEAIVVTSQRASILPIDVGGKILRNAILWLDKRSLKECKLINAKNGEDKIYDKTGLRIDPYFSAPKILWIKKHHPDVYHNTLNF